MGRIWAVCSGSGGVGKTTLALSLAIGASQRGRRTLLLDASGIARACDLLLGMQSLITIDLVDVLGQQAELQTALYPVSGFSNLHLAHASLYEELPLSEISGIILALQSMFDLLIIDLPTGEIGADAGIMTHDDTWLLVTRPDDASIRASERLLQRTRGQAACPSLVLNRVRRERIKRGQQYHDDAVAMTLDCPVLGAIPEDDAWTDALFREKRLLEREGPLRKAVRAVLDTLLTSM